MQQRLAQIKLQLLDLARDRRLRALEQLGSTRDAANRHDRNKGFKLAYVHGRDYAKRE
ncbi:hypothetical protein D3C86_2068530 [compost metagenome]